MRLSAPQTHLLLIPLIPQVIQAAAPRSTDSRPHSTSPTSLLAQIEELGLTAAEKEGVFGSLERFRSVTKSVCHSRIAARLTGVCRLDKEESIGEGERIEVAISLTLCSMASALQPIPSECHTWTEEREGEGDGKGKRNDQVEGWWRGGWRGKGVVEQQRALCLSALHRSPQDWTSYNGYMSDALQLCHALQSQGARDQAKASLDKVYKEKAELIKLLRDMSARRNEQDIQTTEAMEERLEAARMASSSLDHLISRFQDDFESQQAVMQSLRNAADHLEGQSAQVWRELRGEGGDAMSGLARDMESGLRGMRSELAHQLLADLRLAADEHSLALTRSGDDMAAALTDMTLRANEQVGAMVEWTGTKLSAQEVVWQELTQMSASLQTGIERLDEDIGRLSPTVRQSVADAETLHELQNQHMSSMLDTAAQSVLIRQQLGDVVAMINGSMQNVQIWSKGLGGHRWAATSFSLFSGPAIFDASRLSALGSPAAIKAMAMTLNLTLGLALKVGMGALSFGISAIVSLALVAWLGTFRFFVNPARRVYRRLHTAFASQTVDEEMSKQTYTPAIHFNHLVSGLPPGYASPDMPIRYIPTHTDGLGLYAEPRRPSIAKSHIGDDAGGSFEAFRRRKSEFVVDRKRRAVTCPP